MGKIRIERRGSSALHLNSISLRDFGTKLRAWYRRQARDLPWRRTRDPYAILVSELMLQQTQVSRVLEYWTRFLHRFPTLETLASAQERHVLAQWKGLGYYARARNLHKLSRAVVREGARAWGDNHVADAGPIALSADGQPSWLPAEAAKLRRLPGVGAYTAGAVSTFAFERRAALVDTNVARVLARVFAPRLNPKRPRDLTVLWQIAEHSLPRTGKATWTHNQALMELGALVCTARVKRCGACPVRTICASRESAL
ncbi:MAG: A/G-specific adenine glycosylase [Gemmatimonadaceae bacterium]|nr:A/G-specific adenine glycosylase [Gemmatimonadaceae bacterium]